MTSSAVNRRLQTLADAAGAESFAVMRETKHLIVDFRFPNEAPAVRLILSKSCSDSVRGFKNQLGDLRRARRLQQQGE